MTPSNRSPLVDGVLRLEGARSLDGAVRLLEPHVQRLFGEGARGRLLRGEWLGHALHPLMTDLVLGSWTSASLLDVLGDERSAPAAKTLIGVGLAAAGPTAWTGWAEWSNTGVRDKRVGLVHAATNATAIGLYGASWVARHRDHHVAGARLALAGAAVSSVGAYLGGHLASARDVGSKHPVFNADT